MIEKTISEIEAKIGGTETVTPAQKQELLQLLATLKTEVGTLAKTHGEAADSIAGFVRMSAHEATREHQDPELRALSLQGLRSSVTGFETSHPHLAQLVGRISQTLADLGI